MAIPRHLLVDPEVPLFYHLTSRCVRRSLLCGKDPVSGIDYTYRKNRIVKRLEALIPSFALELWGFAVMDNHFHLIVFYDPKAAERWSPEEVADRWFQAFPPRKRKKQSLRKTLEKARAAMLSNPAEIERRRARLGSLSAFMQSLKQPIARAANLEDKCTGHFFEQRFYSGALLDEEAVIASMAYVDLNPVRAQLVSRVQEGQYTSFAHRLNVVNNNKDRLDEAIAPIFSGLLDEDIGQGERGGEGGLGSPRPRLPITWRAYQSLVGGMDRAGRNRNKYARKDTPIARWQARVDAFSHRQRAYGQQAALEQWLEERGFHAVETPLD